MSLLIERLSPNSSSSTKSNGQSSKAHTDQAKELNGSAFIKTTCECHTLSNMSTSSHQYNAPFVTTSISIENGTKHGSASSPIHPISPSRPPLNLVQQRLQGSASSFDHIESGERSGHGSHPADRLHLRLGSTHELSEEEAGNDSETSSSCHSATNHRRKSSNPVVRLLCKFTRKQAEEKRKDITLDMLQPSRYKPNDLEQMAEDTKFSKREVRSLYRAFKQECPNGIVDEETFKDVYEKIFPLGDATHYAHLVFLAIDRDRTGGITFGDFMDFLSVISKGSFQDKLLWTFTFYDVDHDGFISKDEMLKVTDAIHELMGSKNPTNTMEAHLNVDKIFETMDANCDGLISMEEFVQYCTSTTEVRESLEVLP